MHQVGKIAHKVLGRPRSISTAVLATCRRDILRNMAFGCEWRMNAPQPSASMVENVVCFGGGDIACNRSQMSLNEMPNRPA